MIIRLLTPEDESKLRDIHARYYADEFSFDEFKTNFINTFAVVDDKDRIITGGGIRVICEAVIVTDKAYSPRQRREALLQILQLSEFLARRNGFRELHATAQDRVWLEVLKRYHFAEPKGKFLSLGL